MIPSRSQFGGIRLPLHEPGFSQPELQAEIEAMFLNLCDLLEEYAPAWYSDRLREKIESVRRLIGK